ncbi:hypothetical protein BS78_03G146800 [Paspalum vaginatum]|nr:hypothetical protein BS78_03G146800 [Paspalum vaginatum]
MEAVISPMVDNNGADSVLDNVVPSGSVVEEKEHINGDDVATITATVVNNNNDDELNVESTKDGHHMHMAMECSTPTSSSPSSRKKRGAFSLFRAVFLSFGRSDSTKKAGYATASPKKIKAIAADDVGKADGDWKALVDGMRPLRLRGQELEYYPPPPPLGHADVYHDVLLPPPSPARSGFEEVGMTSRYASAHDLQQMDGAEEEGAPEAEGGQGEASCPHAIDMQAEEFIAKFYEQFTSESFINGPASE